MADDDVWAAFSRRLFDQNRFAIKLGLDNICRALEVEGHPERASTAVVVGGTNGKGETAASLASIFQASGHRVGLYTSPHLLEVRERFRVDGVPVGRDAALAAGRHVLERYGQRGDGSSPSLTFFEMTTLMASLLFARHSVDIAIYEVGLGGRLDAVNAIEPALTVVTTVDFDHQKYLGETLPEIAAEKAALFRDGTPSVIGFQVHEAAHHVLESAAPGACVAERDFTVNDEEIHLGQRRCALPKRYLPVTRRKNMATAVAGAFSLLGDGLSCETVERGLRSTRWPGRMEELTLHLPAPQRLFVDAAHNVGGAGALFEELRSRDVPLAAGICGGMADKDLSTMFAPLEEFELPTFGALLQSERAAGERQLRAAIPAGVLREIGPTGEVLRRAAFVAGAGVVLVFGSVYLIGEVFGEAGVDASDLATFVEDASSR